MLAPIFHTESNCPDRLASFEAKCWFLTEEAAFPLVDQAQLLVYIIQ
jgi:hypothetical protein